VHYGQGAFYFTAEKNRGLLLGTVLEEQVFSKHFLKVTLWPNLNRSEDGVISEK
jgi:hypothetical protein